MVEENLYFLLTINLKINRITLVNNFLLRLNTLWAIVNVRVYRDVSVRQFSYQKE